MSVLRWGYRVIVGVLFCLPCSGFAVNQDFSPPPEERQLPLAMHSVMRERPQVTVGHAGQAEQTTGADLIGSDNRVIQAAVEYVAALGGGTVFISPGTYLMWDSLHLRSGVTVTGIPGKTILKKADARVTPLVRDGDFGEQQFTVEDPSGFEVGYGVTIRDDRSGGFHTTVARITGRDGNTFSIDKPLMADCMVNNNARAATVFPVVSGYDIEGAHIENITIDGNKANNSHLNGCRGAGLFLYRAFGTVIKGCVVANYNGDGISFQQSNDVAVLECVSHDNASLGLHPGSGSQRPTVKNCLARGNGTDGLFLCWRVRHGLFEGNILEHNGQFGISIGHKDSDNLLRRNTIRSNGECGLYFRNESTAMAAHRNRIEDNTIENNGVKKPSPGIRIRGYTNDLVFKENTIRDTRESGQQTQTVGILIEEHVGEVVLKDNRIQAQDEVVDRRKTPR
jgi:parallel beta-helix repeat protein